MHEIQPQKLASSDLNKFGTKAHSSREQKRFFSFSWNRTCTSRWNSVRAHFPIQPKIVSSVADMECARKKCFKIIAVYSWRRWKYSNAVTVSVLKYYYYFTFFSFFFVVHLQHFSFLAPLIAAALFL